MEVEKQDWDMLNNAITHWEETGIITKDKAAELRHNIHIKQNSSQQIARYFFIVAISCTILAFGAIFIDEKLLETIKAYFSLSNIFIALAMAILGTLWFWYINRRKTRHSTFANEVYMVLGGLTFLTALVYLCKDIGFGASRQGMLLAATIMLCILSVRFKSIALWIGGLLALIAWYGAFTTSRSVANMFWGMNYPMRYTLLGIAVILLSFLQKRVGTISFSQRITFIAGLLLSFISLWAVSVFGNYGYLDEWAKVRQTQVLVYAGVFGIVSILTFLVGIRYQDDLVRDFGIVFLLLNLYSRYFEFFWDSMNKGVFFLVLAVSFWFIGRRIEQRLKRKA